MSVHITQKVAYDLVKQAAHLFYQGTGVVLEPTDELQHTGSGFIDEIDPDHPESATRYWANLLLHFARTVHGILNTALLTGQEMIEDG